MSSWARVLVADDHQPMLRLLTAMLAREFVVIEGVSDGGQLVDAEARLNPDVIVADISMPVMSGLEAAARIRQRGSRVPIVCISTYDEADVRQAALAAGVVAFVLKSALAVDLIPAVRAALAGSKGVVS